MDDPDRQGNDTVWHEPERQLAHRIKNLLSPAALYLDAVLLRENRLDDRSRDQLLGVQSVIAEVCRELEAMQERRPADQGPLSVQEPAPALTGGPEPGLRLLLVDDDVLLLSSLARTLEFDRHAVQCASSAEQALELAATAHANGQTFEVVITDLSMQGMDGQGLARRLKAEGWADHVVLLTGWGSTQDGGQELPEGVDQWLSKPPRLAALRLALQQAGRRG